MFPQRKWFQPLALLLCISILIFGIVTKTLAKSPLAHPLDSLTATEIQKAVTILKKEKSLGDKIIFTDLTLREPDKQTVVNFKPDNPISRQVIAVIHNPLQHQTHEAIVDLTSSTLVSWQAVTTGQPSFADSDYDILTELAKADAQWQAAMRKRGITDFEPAIIDGWVDLDRREVVEVKDYGVIPFSQENFDYNRSAFKSLQPAPKPLSIQQPKGVTFQLNKNQVTWQNWTFRYLMHPREGLTLYQVSYNDKGKQRPILYRASISEMVVPYADTAPPWVVRSAFDVGEYRFGWLLTTLIKDKDVPNNALLLDALFTDETGKPTVRENILGIYERDGGILWRHYDFNTETYEGHRSRELVLSTVAAIGNYDYGVNWIFHQDGTLEVEVDLTGIMLAKATADVMEHQGNMEQFGHLVAPKVIAVNHQHFMNFRLDFDVDGTENAIAEMTVTALAKSDSNPQGNAFMMQSRPLRRESEAVRDLNLKESRSWVVENQKQKNTLGGSIGYMLMPGTNTVFYPLADSNVSRRGEFATHHLWVTQYQPNELYAAGNYPNQGLSEQGLPQWINDDQSLEGEDLVVWYTMGVTHIPRPEEWPIMTVHPVSFKIMPRGFFTQNPVLNISEPESLSFQR